MTLDDIFQLTRDYAQAHDALAASVTDLNDEITALKRRYLAKIKRLTAAAATCKASLHTAIESAPALFTKPRTYVFDGVKVGLTKQRGSLTFADADGVIARIKKIYKDEASQFIQTTEKPDKDALKNLTATELAKLGCSVTEDADKVVIAPTASDVEKIVAALLADAVDENLDSTEAA